MCADPSDPLGYSTCQNGRFRSRCVVSFVARPLLQSRLAMCLIQDLVQGPSECCITSPRKRWKDSGQIFTFETKIRKYAHSVPISTCDCICKNRMARITTGQLRLSPTVIVDDDTVAVIAVGLSKTMDPYPIFWPAALSGLGSQTRMERSLCCVLNQTHRQTRHSRPKPDSAHGLAQGGPLSLQDNGPVSDFLAG